MRSYVKIDSLYIDLTDYFDKTSDPGKCEHFSMRGYVSEIRQKDWKSCWPFAIQDNHNESEQSPLLPPCDAPKLSCRSFQQELASEGSHKDDGKDLNCCTAALNSDTQQAPIAVTFEGKEIDLNNSTNLSNGNDHVAISNEKEKKADVEDCRINNEISLEGLNHQISSVSSPILCGGMRQEQQTNNKGGEGKEVFDVKLDPGNLKCKDKSSAETCNGGKPIVADNQCPKETEKACEDSEKGTLLTEADKIVDHTAGLPPPDSVACHEVKQGSIDNLVKNEFQDQHLGKSTGLPRKKPRKVRLLTDLLSGNGETKTEQITVQESPSEGSSSHQGKTNDQGDLTKMAQSRKRKFIVDEEQMVEIEPESLKENTEAIDPVLNNGSEDVCAGVSTPDVVKNNGCKPETERSHMTGIKKNKKIQIFSNHFISESQKGKEKQNQDKMDFANDGYASKTTSKLAPAPAFTEKGVSNFPLHAPRTENESKFSKGKGKMLQVDQNLPSPCCRNGGMLVENSFAHQTAKVTPNMAATIPNHSAEGLMKEKCVEEGLHLSLKSYLATQDYSKICIHQNENRLPFSLSSQEGTSRTHQFVRKEWETNVGKPIIPFECITDDVSGKRARFEEIAGARNVEETAEALAQVGMFSRYNDRTPDTGSEQESEDDDDDYDDDNDDDVPMDIVDFMARFQYLRGLPDTKIEKRLKRSNTKRRSKVGNTINGKGEQRLLKDDQKEIARGRGENVMVMRGKNVRSRERNTVHGFSSSKGNPLNLNSLSQASLYGIEASQPQMKPSGVFHFSPLSSSQLGSARNHRLNRITAECGSSNPTSQSRGGCSLHQTILQQDDKASRVWESLTPNPVSLRYDIFENGVISHSTSTKDMQKQNVKRDIDINCINLNPVDYEKLNRERAPGPLSGMNAEYPFSCKHVGIEPPQNLRESRHMYSNETIPAMHLLNLMDASKQCRTPFNTSVNSQMLNRPLYPGDSHAKLEMGTTSKASLVGSLKRPPSDHFNKSYLPDKQHGCFGFPTLGASSSVGQGEKVVTSFNGRIPSKSGMKDKMKSSNSAMHNRGNTQQLNWPYLEKETSLQRQFKIHDACGTSVPVRNSSGSNTCSINRNPADFTVPDARNVYMIKGEDLKFEEASTSRNRLDMLALHSCRQLKNLKPSK
ncbi:protein EMBRYONIC FLOWER 1 [Neltuma alba]|uniref:protein EMBRYONIC FLOWER 1 n=1 Tax=Neltuma alba TaxID=207710 RepID=UPI0010A45D44|nr:protein EMBRYONIC FLOWER 1-like [Prosopis alba]